MVKRSRFYLITREAVNWFDNFFLWFGLAIWLIALGLIVVSLIRGHQWGYIGAILIAYVLLFPFATKGLNKICCKYFNYTKQEHQEFVDSAFKELQEERAEITRQNIDFWRSFEKTCK